MSLLGLIRDKEYVRLLFYRTIGNFLIIISLIIIGKTWGPAIYQEGAYAFRQAKQVKTRVVSEVPAPELQQPPQNAFLSLLDNFTRTEEVLVPPDPNFSIIIPKIAASSKVVPNVNGAIYEDYIKALESGVAHTQGTAFPGDGGHIYLFAHSTDTIFNVGTYNAVFYLLYKLEQGDEIYLFYQGKKYAYKVIDKKTIESHEVQYLTRQSTSEFLTLQTCWPPGTTLKRLLVFAVPVAE